MSAPRLIRIVPDASVPAGEFHVGGVRTFTPRDDEHLGRELRTTEVRVNGDDEAEQLREWLRNDDRYAEVE